MTVAAIIIAALALCVAGGAWFTRDRQPKPTTWVDEVTFRRVLVHTTDDSTFDGVLIRVEPELLVLADASNLDRDDPVELAGEQWIDRSRVHFVQVVPS